jgi:hypothetical protein
MNRQVKKRSEKARKRRKDTSPRGRPRFSLSRLITGITLRFFSILALSLLALSVILFSLSTIFAWLYNERSEIPKPPAASIEILNGCGIEGAAMELTSILRKNGYDVVDFRNAERFDYANTVVIVRGLSPEEGEVLTASLGCEHLIRESPEPGAADVSIVMGEDWKELKIVTGQKDTRERLKAVLDFFDKLNYLN